MSRKLPAITTEEVRHRRRRSAAAAGPLAMTVPEQEASGPELSGPPAPLAAPVPGEFAAAATAGAEGLARMAEADRIDAKRRR
jgi:hypothetical protein